ncbi:MAG: NYN domain-containing protein [Candidatus Paceibacterota bacterium]
MDLENFKKQFTKGELEITEDFGRVFSFIDFSNVNKWFENDNQDWNNKLLSENEKLSIDLGKLKLFADIFSERARMYYGEDPKNIKSLSFTDVIRIIFGKRDVITKDLQKIKHYFKLDEAINSKRICVDENNKNYIEIRKCNFDVEISVDAIKMLEHYDTFCIFSGDADFVYLNNFLRKKGKKIIIIKAGYITSKLRKSADLVINAQNIKKNIVKITKQKPD